MINNSSANKWERLSQKQLDVQFVNQLLTGLNCSRFEAQAIMNCVYEVYQPFFDNAASMRPGQILFEVVTVENSAKEKLSDCRMTTVVLTLDAGQGDLSVREKEGVIGLRRHRLERIANECFQQGGLLTVEDIANRLLNCGERTLVRDIKELKTKGIILPLRSTIKDMGRSITHREMIVKHWLMGMELSEIARRTNHSIEAAANYVEKFRRVVFLANSNHEIKTIAFLVKISVCLAQQYYDLYQNLEIVPSRLDQLSERIKKRIFNIKSN